MPKFNLKQTVLLIVAAFASISLHAQNNLDGSQQNNVEQNIENIVENASNQDLDYTTLLEQYNFFKAHPINLNTEAIESLRDLSLVSDIQLKSLLVHIKKNMPLINVYELQSIENWDLATIQKIMPFVYVSQTESLEKLSFAQILKEGVSSIDIRTQRVLESQAGFTNMHDSLRTANPNNYYLGNPYKHFLRYRFTSGNRILWGITAEKDPGEEFFKGSQKQGFDYYSAYIFAKDIGKIKALALGDYRAEFGQGLTFWSDLAFSKSVDLLVYKKNAKGIRAYNSLNENQYLRGVATTLGLHKNLDVSVFFSRKKRDAMVSIDTAETINNEGFSNFLLAGLHRTQSEVAKKNTITETLYGSNIQYKKRTFSIGTTSVYTQFDVAQKTANNLYSMYNITGTNNYNIGIDYNLVVRNIDFFGETSQSKNGGRALLSGALASLDPKLNLLALYRNYQRNYQAIYVRAIGETVGAQNEKGLLLGLQYKPIYNLTMSAYYDRFSFPWLRYKINLPNATGSDFTCLIDYAITKKTSINFRFRRRVKPQDIANNTEVIKSIGNTLQDYYRVNFVYSFTPEIRLKTRIDFNYFTSVSGAKSMGTLFYQDLVFKKMQSPITLTVRYTLFDISGYDARVYALETDLPFAYSFLSYSGTGSRFYTMINYEISKRFECWVRYGQTFYLNQKTLNAGTANESTGPLRSELKLQIRYKF